MVDCKIRRGGKGAYIIDITSEDGNVALTINGGGSLPKKVLGLDRHLPKKRNKRVLDGKLELPIVDLQKIRP